MAISLPIYQNPDAALAMNPIHQPSPPATPTPTLNKPSLPKGLQQEINRFAIDGFAHKFFATHKKGLFRRTVPMDEMLKWTRDSIPQPLIMMNKELYKDALRCFKLIQMIMGDRSRCKDEVQDIQTILNCGITKGQMRDEIYVQLCKQLQDNPNPASVHKGWELLCIVSVTFPPSKDLESYLSDFVEQHHHSIDVKVSVISQHVSSKLVKICKRGAKGKVLTAAEIARAKEAPFKPSVFGESLQLMMEMQAHKDKTLKIPKVVPFLADAVREINGKLSEGIFRIPGDADAVTDLRVRIENGNYDAEGITDPNVPASLLKYWLRDLTDPIIPSESYYDCIQSAEDADKAIAIINTLPDTNRRIALFIINFLQEFNLPEVITHTLMNVNNLAMVFAPNFLRCPSESLTTVFKNSKYEQAFLRTLINQIQLDPSLCLYEPDITRVIGYHIFEPPPTWRPHYYPRRSPLHHQPSLSEIVYQDYNESRLSSSYYQEYDSDYEDSQRNNDDGSMFTAAEDVGDEEFERHGHLLSSTEPIVDYMKRCHIQPTAEWKDYKAQYDSLNESFDHSRIKIYKRIYAAMEKMQDVDSIMDKAKSDYQTKMDSKYHELHKDLVDKCRQVNQKVKQSVPKQIRFEPSEKVRLNVGGSLFETSLSTLCRDPTSLLASMFSGRHLLSVESDGSYFIDRDPTHFRLVLNYLRDLRIPPVILQDRTIREELLQEANYYCIRGLVDLLSHQA
ncbi:hypothetical protein G6F52_003578 [Rhizopus delemar]|nr:hypothetical protein G6F52_003578 [Rhizopus delemar]